MTTDNESADERSDSREANKGTRKHRDSVGQTSAIRAVILRDGTEDNSTKPVVSCNKDANQLYCVTTSLGEVCGTAKTTLNKPLVRYLGIPYAAPPVGKLRFKPPQPITKYDKKIEATAIPSSCIQDNSMRGMHPGFDHWFPPLQGPGSISEDCLYLNIIAPKTDKPLPVMFWIHGGGYYMGMGYMETGTEGDGLAAAGEVVVVTINYRLGPLGFLYLGNDDIPGNAGLLDQQAALKWVNEHIGAFGGDRERVTLFGESAGGGSVNAHLGSPESLPFYKAVILQSGTMQASWGQLTPKEAVTNVHRLADHIDCDLNANKNDDAAAYKCLMAAPADKLIANLATSPMRPFTSPVEGDKLFFGGKSLEENLKLLDLSDKVIILGSTSRDAGLMLPFIHPSTFRYDNAKDWHIEMADFIEKATVYLGSTGSPRISKAMLAVLHDYKTDLTIGHTYVDRLIQFYTDHMFICPAFELATNLAVRLNAGIYVYEYNHTNSKSPFPAEVGAIHTYDIQPVFGYPLIEDGWTEGEKGLSRRMIDYWTNLAKIGGPAVKKAHWVSFNPDTSPYMMMISTGDPKMVSIEEKLTRCKRLTKASEDSDETTKEEL